MPSVAADADREAFLRMPPAAAAEWLDSLAARYVSAASPTDALRFLLDLDNRLYARQGRASVAYGNGLHTKHRHMRYHDFFVERIRPGESVLDVGCGNGALTCDVAARAGARVTGIELCEANLRIARERYAHPDVTYVHGDALRDLPPGRYDVVLLSNVLEHIGPRVDFLRRLARTAAPSRWLIRVPVFDRDWRVPLKKELGLEWRLDGTHCTEYTAASFAGETAAAGLTIVHEQICWGEIWSELITECRK
jgi:SAM-dependent methyltransferase